ncbi:DUF3986 family protein [Aneurinibacillus thermoaerophilus]|uniref:DUF3986 family protein n=1 Tax=Aneurinibacillus TaxID=55079 RepID=UPI00138F0553|nr:MULTISPECIES: DUF3986 family protein [Aneurinibacillus]MED0761468.1 DUF3986 family protein [Aneurinibacillus thermoaerophilus]
MSDQYDHNIHLHIGYQDENYDIEVIAFKKKDADIWDVYINFEENSILVNKSLTNSPKIDPFGYYAFSIIQKDISYEEGSIKLKEWLLKNQII